MFSIQTSGTWITGEFVQPYRFEVRVFTKRKRFIKATRKAGMPKKQAHMSDAAFLSLDNMRKNGTVGKMYLMSDASMNTIMHECVHAGIRMAHQHFGAILTIDQQDKRALQEEAVAYLSADLFEELHAALQ